MTSRTATLYLLLLLTVAGCGPAKEQVTAEQLLAEARRLNNIGDTQESLVAATKAVELAPDNTEALTVASLAHLMRSRELQVSDQSAADELVLRGAEFARRLQTAKPELNGREEQLVSCALYKEACVYARSAKPDQSLKSLEAALEAGYPHLHHVRSDPELQNIHQIKAFETLVDKAVEKVRQQRRDRAIAEMQAFKTFDFSFSLPDIHGQTVSLDDLRGNVVVVDFWGTWCEPCRQGVPHFAKLHDEYNAKGVKVIGINYEELPRDLWRQRVAQFVEKRKLPYTFLLGDDETQNRVPNLKIFPTTLFIDRQGKVRLKAEGNQPYDDLVAVVEQLLQE